MKQAARTLLYVNYNARLLIRFFGLCHREDCQKLTKRLDKMNNHEEQSEIEGLYTKFQVCS
jgi:hypothetical protein